MSHRDTPVDNPLDAEKDAMKEAELVSDTPDEADAEEVATRALEKGAQVDDVLPAEAAAIHTDTEVAREASGDEDVAAQEDTKKKKKRAKVAKAAKREKKRSAKYEQHATKIDRNKVYSVKEAVALAKDTSYTNFDGAIEVHIRLAAPKGKKKDDGERYRTMVLLPHGTGKEPKIGVIDDELLAQIKQKGDTEYDILIATPAMMPKVAQVAKILGPKGKMPNPKTGTVAEDPETAKRAILSGRVEVKADPQGGIHQAIGRVSWNEDKLLENFQALLGALPSARLRGVTISATMGPGIAVQYSV